MEKFSIASQTHIGRRENNEDAFLELKLGNKGLFLAVADGMGGYEGGEIASNLILFKIKQFLEKNYQDLLNPENLKSILNDCFELAQYTIRQKILEEPLLHGMGTTLTAVLIYDNCYAYGNIGDSRIYLIAPGITQQITADHTYIEEFQQKFQEPATPEFLARYGHILTRTIDGKLDVPDIFPVEESYLRLNPEEMLLLCSDGLLLSKSEKTTSFITTQIKSTQSIEESVKQLVSFAYDNGASDNITVVLARYNRQLITKEIEKIPKKEASKGSETIQFPAYIRKNKLPFFSKKTLNIIGLVSLAICAMMAVVSMFDLNPFEQKEPGSRQRINVVAKPQIEAPADHTNPKEIKSYSAAIVNQEREKYLLLISKILSYKFTPQVLNNLMKDIRNAKPPFISDLKTDLWKNILKDQIVKKGSKRKQLIVEPGKIIRRLDATRFLILTFKVENEEAKDCVDYVAKNGMQFFTGALATIVSKYLPFSEVASIVRGQIIYMVTYDNEGNIIDNPFQFDAANGSFPEAAIKQTYEGRQLAPLIISYKNRETIDLIYPLNENKGCLRVGFPLQASN